MTCIQFTVNGKKCSVDTSVPRDTSLNAFLRYHLALPGTKAMCHQGGCGACIVSVCAYNQTTGRVETFSVNSCLVLVFSCQGWDITTVEGLGNRHDGYHEIQTRTAAFHATQCGYCTAGWEMHLYSLLDKNMTMAELEDAFGSNTCRCTGYRPILDTIKSFAVDASAELCDQVADMEDLPICKNSCEKTCKRTCERKMSTSSDENDWTIVNELAISPQAGQIIFLNFGFNKYYKVFTEAQIFEVFRRAGIDSYMLLDGNTARGILGIHEQPTNIFDIRDVKSLKQFKIDQNLILGANMTLEDCIALFKDVAKSHAEFAYLKEFVKHMLLIANMPVRHIASLAGNVMIKHRKPSSPSDMFVLLAAVGATMRIKDMFGARRELSMEEFLRHDMRGVLIVNFELPPFGRSHVFRSYKILPRSQTAPAIVNAAFLLNINSRKTVEQASIVYGNISDCFIHAVRTEEYLIGKNAFNTAVVQGAINVLEAELIPQYDPAIASIECRKKLAIGLFYKFILNINPKGNIPPHFRSGAYLLERPVSCGTQEYTTDPSLYPLNHPVKKYEGLIQTSGEAQFANDVPPMKNEVFGAFVQSTVHSGELDCIDASEALKMDGVLALYTAKDIPGVNSFTFPEIQLNSEDEEIVATSKIMFYGQPVAIIVAESQALAAKAATKVHVSYKNVRKTPPVLTINEAKKDSKRLILSDVKVEAKVKGTNTTKVVKGVYEIGAQYHFYMEPLTCVVIPVDRGLEVHDSCQWMDQTQIAIARCLNINESDVIVKVRRVGGGFGGKISRNVQVATACALVAKKMNRPCRFILPLSTNLAIAGGRVPCQCDYEVGVDDNGEIQYLNAIIVQNVGCSDNENILSFTANAFRNLYKKDYFNMKLYSALTDHASNSYCRGPGSVEGISSMEHIMEHIATAVNKDPTEVRLRNMRTEDNDLPELIETLKKKSDYDRRYNEIQQFNRANRWIKKAIKINVMLYPVIYYGNYSVLVSIYRGDGTVTVSTGGVELGQGANTKVRQVVAYEMGIPMDLVSVIPHYSFVAANNVFTGSSIVSESCCYAAIKACTKLKNRLKPVADSLIKPTWIDIVKEAGKLEVDLVAEYMMSEKEPDLSGYSAFAVTVLEAELDVLTGKYLLNRLDILEDVGVSINPAIDVGQIEGAYMLGLGYFTTEKLVFDKQTGKLCSDDALTYTVYLAKDIPVDMRVMLRENSKNPKGVLGSKAVGEMGVCIAHGVTHVLRQCIMESRKDSGYDPKEWIDIEVPYTTESILKALNVKPSELALAK